MKSSIGAKIFALAVALLGLNLVLASFLVSHVFRLDREFQIIANHDLPLDTSLSRLSERALRRRLAFEHLEASLGNPRTDAEQETAATANFEQQTKSVLELLATIEQRLADYPRASSDLVALTRMEERVKELTEAYPLAISRQRELIEALRAKDHGQAASLRALVLEGSAQREKQRTQLEEVVDAHMNAKTKLLTEEQHRVVWLTIAAAISLVALGLVLAKILTLRIVQPIHELVGGIKTLETGDFSTLLPVRTSDEIGTLTAAFNVCIGEMRGKEELRRTFGKYIDPRILDQFILNPAASAAGGDRREMTIGFSDLVGFSALSEQLTPAGLVNLLNRHFSLQAEAIQAHRGVVDKFIGDAVMAFWGAPFTAGGDHAELACRAALAQTEALVAFRAELPELTGLRRNLPNIDARIGLNSGEVIVGNIGAENTRSYTVIGDTVNLASRLEGANRPYGTRILISESTRALAGAKIETREIDALTVKGKTEPTRVFELLGLAGATSDSLLHLRETFEPALAAYRAQDWVLAEAGFRACLALAPSDGPANLFLERVRTLRANAPARDWNGVWHLETK